MKPYLFITSSYNDIDNQLPLLWKMAQSGRSVRVIFLDRNANIDIEADPRFAFIRNKIGCPVEYYYALEGVSPRFANKPLLRSSNPVFVKVLRSFLSVMHRQVWNDRWAEKVIEMIDPALCVTRSEVEEGTLENKLMKAAYKKGIPILGASHGPNVYTNVDRSVPAKRPFAPFKKSSSTHLLCTRVIALTPHEKALWAEEGFERMDKIVVTGCPRYSDEWLAINAGIYPDFKSKKSAEGRLKVLFFMPHFGSHVDRQKTLEGLERLAVLDFIHLIVKEHTREGAGNVSEELKAKFAASANVEVIESAKAVSLKEWMGAGFRTRRDFDLTDSTPLVRWADTVVCFSTSIGMEAIAQGKPLINPVYMYRYASIYDVYGPAVNVESHEELVRCVRGFKDNLKAPYTDERYRKAMIFAEKEPHNVLESYRELLVSMAEKRPAKEADGPQLTESLHA